MLIVVSTASLAVIVLSFARTDNTAALHITTGVSWQNPTVLWCFEGSMPTTWQTEYTQATNTWSNPSNWFLVYTQNCNAGAGAKIKMWHKSFSQNNYGTAPGRCFCYSSGSWMTAALIYLNTDYSWTNSRAEGSSMGSEPNNICVPSCDIETIALHELGHTARFQHPLPASCPAPNPKSAMCVDFIIRRLLTAHDIEAAQWVY